MNMNFGGSGANYRHSDERIRGLTAYILSGWPDDIVSRATVRALLPRGYRQDSGSMSHVGTYMRGRRPKRMNDVSRAFGFVLKHMEEQGLIARGEVFLRITDRRGLVDVAGNDGVKQWDIPLVEGAIRAVREQLRAERSAAVKERRTRELETLERIMTSFSGASSAHRGVGSLWPVHANGAVARTPDADTTRVSDGLIHPVDVRHKSDGGGIASE